VVITSALHAEGRGFDPRLEYLFLFLCSYFSKDLHCFSMCMALIISEIIKCSRSRDGFEATGGADPIQIISRWQLQILDIADIAVFNIINF
jgi:hypothetical protein